MPRRLPMLCVALLLLSRALAECQGAAPAVKAPALAPPAEVAQKADVYLQAQARVNGFNGVVLIARDGTPVISKGYGRANAEWEIANTPPRDSASAPSPSSSPRR